MDHILEFKTARLDGEDLILDGTASLIIDDDGVMAEWKVQYTSPDRLAMTKMLTERGKHRLELTDVEDPAAPVGSTWAGWVLTSAVNAADGRVVLQGSGPPEIS